MRHDIYIYVYISIYMYVKTKHIYIPMYSMKHFETKIRKTVTWLLKIEYGIVLQ